MRREERRVCGDLCVTTLGLGAAALGNLYAAISDDTARAVFAMASDLGISHIDTAPLYGFGLSEKRVGVALNTIGESVVVSSKVGRLLIPSLQADVTVERDGFLSPEPFEAVFDYSYDGVMHAFEDSQKRLGRDCIDILYAHDLGAMTHGAAHAERFGEFLKGGYRALRDLRDLGLTRAIGLGVNEWQVCEAVLAEVDLDCVLLAGRYTLLEQTALDSFLPLCADRGVAVVVGGPYNSGALVASETDAHYNYGRVPSEIAHRIRRLRATAQRHGVPLPAAALQFVLAHPAVVSVIPGMSSPGHVRQASDWLDLAVPDDFWAELKAEGILRSDAPVPTARALA